MAPNKYLPQNLEVVVSGPFKANGTGSDIWSANLKEISSEKILLFMIAETEDNANDFALKLDYIRQKCLLVMV